MPRVSQRLGLRKFWEYAEGVELQADYGHDPTRSHDRSKEHLQADCNLPEGWRAARSWPRRPRVKIGHPRPAGANQQLEVGHKLRCQCRRAGGTGGMIR
eukprot:1477001-Prymnesium_polylepis.1